MGAILFWMGVLCIVVPFLIGAFVRIGMGDDEEDYMIDPEWRDKP